MRALIKRPLVLAAGCWVAFAGVLAAAYWLPVARWADGYAIDGFLGLQRPRLDALASRVAHLANPLPFALATAALVLIALHRGRPRHALGAVVLLAGSNVTSQVLKRLLAHDRPHAFLGAAQLNPVSFPSGHATASMSLALAALLVAPAAWRTLVAAGGALFTLGVSESVLLLAWHFPSDIIGGYLVAASFACVVMAGLGAAQERWPERTGREAARRAFGSHAVKRAAGRAAAGFGAACVLALVVSGRGALHFADRHTTAVAAILGVAAMAAALPAGVAVLSARRP